MSNYIKELEDQNEELRQKLAAAEQKLEELEFKKWMDHFEHGHQAG